MNVAVLGASDNPERYAYKAVKLLQEKGHQIFPINPKLENILGIKVYASLSQVTEPLDTISVYLSAAVSSSLREQIVSAKAKRIIFNPGAENIGLENDLRSSGVLVLEACTLVMLTTGQF
jgi:hypothetical protein